MSRITLLVLSTILGGYLTAVPVYGDEAIALSGRTVGVQGGITTIEYAGALETKGYAINAAGGVAGRSQTPDGTMHGSMLGRAGFHTLQSQRLEPQSLACRSQSLHRPLAERLVHRPQG